MLTSKQATVVHTDDGDLVLGGLELPEGDIDGDTTLTLGLQFVKNPSVLEGLLAKLFGFLLKELLVHGQILLPLVDLDFGDRCDQAVLWWGKARRQNTPPKHHKSHNALKNRKSKIEKIVRERQDLLPSRTSRWYGCQYHHTCRSSDL